MPEPARRGAVRADAAGERGEVVDDLGLGVVEEASRGLLVREVVVGAAGDNHLVAVALQTLDEVRAEEAGAAGDERFHPPVLQSTRPIQLARLAAYQRIVCRTPSSHETSGCQPVSALSFSWPTLSASTSLAPGR